MKIISSQKRRISLYSSVIFHVLPSTVQMNHSMRGIYRRTSVFYYDLNSSLLAQSQIENTWLYYVELFFCALNARTVAAASRDFLSKFQHAFKRKLGKCFIRKQTVLQRTLQNRDL